MCVNEAAFKPWNHILAKPVDGDPFGMVDLDSVWLNSALIFADFAAIEDVKYLVAFRIAGRPVMNRRLEDDLA
jgi:hypothetical protein